MKDNKNILPIVVAAIMYNNKILLLKRIKEPFKDLWSMPGGKIKFGEYVSDAVKREVLEETGINVEVPAYMGIVSERVVEGDNVVESHLVNIFRCDSYNDNFISSEEGELAWFSRDDLLEREENIVPTDFYIIDEIVLKGNMGLYNSYVIKTDKNYELVRFWRT